jgi:hypothetical protein
MELTLTVSMIFSIEKSTCLTGREVVIIKGREAGFRERNQCRPIRLFTLIKAN